MSVFSGPEVSNDGLIFYYDMNNVEKSWRGRPTTNNATNGKVDYYSRWATTNDYPPLPFSKKTDVYVLTEGNNYFGGSGSFSITNGNTYTVSYWYYIDTTETMQHFMLPLTGSYSVAATASASTFVDTNNTKNVSGNIGGWVWGYKTFTVTSAPTYMRGTYTSGGGDNTPSGKMYITNVVIESGSTPSGPYGYTGGTRSNTQALLDLTGQNTLTTNSLTYNVDGTFTFAGASNYASITNSAIMRPESELTIEYLIKGATPGSWTPIIGYGNGDYTNGNYLCWVETGGALNALCRINNGGITEYRQYSNQSVSSSVWKHLTFTMKIGSTMRSYYNGVDTDTAVSLPAGGSFSYPGTSSAYQIGGAGGTWMNATVPFLKFYNRALTADEVYQNFQATRGRYGV